MARRTARRPQRCGCGAVLTAALSPASEHCQRWRHGHHSWRHTSEGGFDRHRCDVALIADDQPAKTFVLTHHYSGSYPAARLRAGLYEHGKLVGVAVFGVPMQVAVLTRPFPGLVPYVESVELSRFVLLDRVPANSETFFLGQAFRLAAHQGLRGVVSFSDPVPRVRADGTVVSPGHVGTIYQAANGWHTAGRGTPRTLLIGPDGRVLSERALSKIRRQEPGHGYAERQLHGYGARPRRPGESPASWLDTALTDAAVRRVRHPGNHRYLFRVGRTRAERSRVTFAMPAAPYPKKETCMTSPPSNAARGR